MRICKNSERKHIENEIPMIFSFYKYDKDWRKEFNDINEVENINEVFKQKNKTKKQQFSLSKVLKVFEAVL